MKCTGIVIFAVLCLITLSSCLGWKYRHNGKTFTMTTGQSDYHKQAYAEIQRRVDAARTDGSEEVDLLRLECESYDEFIDRAPKSNYHTSAVKVLQRDKTKACKALASAERRLERDRQATERQRERVRRQEERQQQAEEYQRFLETPEGILAEACKRQYLIDEAEAELANEEAIARQSGATDLTRRYEAGQQLVEMKRQLAELRRKYKAKTGRKLNLSECPE
jgi:hypothetical protein